MEIDRRDFLTGLGAAIAMTGFAAPARAEGGAFLGCRRRGGRFEAAICDARGRDIAAVPLPARGHGGAVSPDGRRMAVFARRPDRFAVVIDAADPAEPLVVHPPEGRHFYGHGFFSADGARLYATENDYDRARGVLGVYDAADGFARLGEIETHGTGPHQTLLMPDGRTAIVANGGIETHPDFPRRKLNLPSMEPSIAAIDIVTGKLLDQAALPEDLHRLSLRHIARAGEEIWVGGQYQGAAAAQAPLVGVYRPGAGLTMLDAPGGLYASMKDYCGSVAASPDGASVVVTSPRGGIAHVWDTASREVVASERIADVCGAAAVDGGFLLSDGRGRLWRGGVRVAHRDDVAWDNHLVTLPAA